MSNLKFSVAMSVYKNDNAEYFDRALWSITDNQTVMPDEIVLVVDGYVGDDINAVIEKYSTKHQIFNVIRLDKNGGLGNALRIAVENSKNEIIARMDSDDVSLSKRFEEQLSLLESTNADVVGGYMTEFVDNEDNIVGCRSVLLTDSEIKKDMKKRCPVNHVTVMFKKEAVQSVGGYLDWHYNEDYYLWIRMLEKGCVFANTDSVLVNVRVGKEMYQRRGGLKYFRSEKALQKYMKKNKIIGFSTYFMNVTKRFIVQVLLPNKIRGWVFKTFARKKHDFILGIDFENKCLSNELRFTVAMSVYGKDNPIYFERALKSITTDQTVKPNEIVLVVDGPVGSEIESVIEKYSSQYDIFKVVYLEENLGLGNALKVAIENSTNEIIARMDSDDISMPNRFENQLSLIETTKADIVGGCVSEFVENEEEIVSYRVVKTTDSEIKKDLRKRCPMNHSTVMFKKQSVIDADGYLDWYYNEDYYLWIRMAKNGCKFANSDSVYVNFRLGKDFYRRRGGRKYFKSEMGLQKFMRKNKMISPFRYIVNGIKRFVVQVIMSSRLRGWAFRKFARKEAK